MSISAKDVKELREKTGCGMMDCKKALTEAGGDIEKAAEILVKVRSMTDRKRQTISADDFRALAKDFHVTLPEKFLK